MRSRGDETAKQAPTAEPRIRALVFDGLQGFLKDYDLDLAPILRDAGVPPQAIADDFAWVPLEFFALTLTVAARDTGDPCFGLKYGTAVRFTSNPLGYVMTNAPDLRTALRAFAHLHGALNSNKVEFIESAGSGRVEWSYGVTMANITQLTDFVAARFVCRIQAVAGRSWRPVSVGMMHLQPSDASEYRLRFGKRIAYDQAVNSITVGAHTLAMPMPDADPQLFRLICHFCAQQIEQQKGIDDPLSHVRDAILRCLQRGQVSRSHVAEELNVTPGALHRRLKEAGTTFPRLLDDTRRRVAERYLFESSLTLTDIAARVGYSELSAFSRAARRWFGASPRTLRRRPPSFDAAA